MLYVIQQTLADHKVMFVENTELSKTIAEGYHSFIYRVKFYIKKKMSVKQQVFAYPSSNITISNGAIFLLYRLYSYN